MKKLLLTIALVLTIVGSMTAGTMAQYVKTASTDINPQFKQFNFSAARSANQAFSLQLAPGESKTWNIDVSNTEGGIFSETDMIVTLNLTYNYLPAGLTFSVNNIPYVSGSEVSVATLIGNHSNTQTITITANWADANDNTSYQGRNDNVVTLNLTATQPSIS
jgi:hypothetical protein